MSIPYDFYLNPVPPGSKKKARYHARVAESETIDTAGLLQRMKNHSVQASTVLYGVTELLKYMKFELQKGNNVHINGLGYFSLSLDCSETRNPSEHHAQSISVKDIVFRAEKDAVEELKDSVTFVRTRRPTTSALYSMDELKQKLTEYFKDHAFISSKQFESVCFQRHTTAAKRLKQLVEEGFLVNIGSRARALYVLAANAPVPTAPTESAAE